mmetsp:Transcript_11143/g.5648  ORF Transcript_11143/g.5648 Transcript_11143/m.5648 type:complete len:108 (-) Transcript_11143:164-487(-)
MTFREMKIFNYPEVFLIHLIWNEVHSDPGMLLRVLVCISLELDLAAAFSEKIISAGKPVVYTLKGMILLGINHYSTIFRKKYSEGWLLYDDTRVDDFATWRDVVRYC